MPDEQINRRCSLDCVRILNLLGLRGIIPIFAAPKSVETNDTDKEVREMQAHKKGSARAQDTLSTSWHRASTNIDQPPDIIESRPALLVN
jgi:hypothetical protein